MFPWSSAKVEPLKPLPLSQRQKTYSAATGIVYQYLFAGIGGSKHVFEVSADRQPSFHLAIELPKEGLACCAERMGSPLRWNEEYALAKLSLLAAMDGADKPTDLLEVVRPSSENLLMFMAELNLG